MNTENEPTIQDVLIAMSQFSSQMDGRFDRMDGRFDRVESNITTIKSTMVTKSYLDDKLADLRGEFTDLVRREDTKVNGIVSTLHAKNVFSRDDLTALNQVEVFAKKPTV